MNKETRYAYNYAIIDRETKMCIEVRSTTSSADDVVDPEHIYVRIPKTNDEYFFKYYDEATGKWYYDDAMTQEWFPPTE